MQFVDMWKWFYQPLSSWQVDEYQSELRQLALIFSDNFRSLETDTDKTLALFEESRRRAEQIDAHGYALFFGYWVSEAYIFYKQDLKKGLDYITKLVVEARKPQYQDCPVLGRVYRTLVDTYVVIDPVGYRDKILETADFMEREIPLDHDTYSIIAEQRALVSLALDDLEAAKDHALQYLHRSGNSAFRLTYVHLLLCVICFERNELDEALAHAKKSAGYAYAENRIYWNAEALAWQALINLTTGNDSIARQLYRQAVAKISSNYMPLRWEYSRVIARYFVVEGEPQRAIELIEETLQAIEGQGRIADECECCLEKARILGQMGEVIDEAVAESYQAATHLLDPTFFHAKLKKIENGNYSRY